jgi:predicted DNA-binding transcriptional regulator YafY
MTGEAPLRDLLVTAIRQRRVVTFTYDALPRTVQPAALGVLAGHETLHAYQVGGGSKRGGIPEWRNFALAKITGLAVLDAVFGPDPPGYGHPSFSTVYAALDG